MQTGSEPKLDRQRYAVRQVLYITSRAGRPGVTPVQVTEEIRRTTLDGVVLSYMVMAPSDNESFVLDRAKHEAFPSADAVRSELYRRAKAAIDSIVDDAVAEARASFPDTAGPPLDQQTTVPEGIDQEHERIQDASTATPGTITVKMPDGSLVKAHVKGPTQ